MIGAGYLEQFYTFAPGLVLTRELDVALAAAYAANGSAPLSSAQVLAITGTPPVFPASLKRFADSNPDPRDGTALDNRGRW